MNQKGMDFIRQIDSVTLTASDYKRHLTNTKTMGMLCHTSCSMDLIMLRYMSVNNLSLKEDGHYFLILISDTSPIEEQASDGDSLFGRAFSYVPVQEIVRQLFTGHYMFYMAELDGHLAILLCFFHNMAADEVERQLYGHLVNDCQKIAEESKKQYDIDLAVYLSPLICDVQHISLQYRLLLNYDVYRHYQKKEDRCEVMTLPDLSKKAMITQELLTCAKHLTAAILKFEDVKSSAESFFDLLDHSPIISTDEWKTHFCNYMDFLCHEFFDNGIPLDKESFYENIPKILTENLYMEGVKIWFYNLLDETVARYRRKHQSDMFQRFDHIKTYIDENYTDPNVNVASIADTFSINQTFLSTIFKKQYKVSISSYIQSQRLKKAEYLLRHTDQPIKDIYNQCGFASAETFYRNFKKEFGLSPNRIRHQ